MKMVKQNKLSWADIWPPPGKISPPRAEKFLPSSDKKSYYKFSFTPKEKFIANYTYVEVQVDIDSPFVRLLSRRVVRGSNNKIVQSIAKRFRSQQKKHLLKLQDHCYHFTVTPKWSLLSRL